MDALIAALRWIPDHPVFLDNAGMVYFQRHAQDRNPRTIEQAKEKFAQAIAANRLSIDSHVHMEAALLSSFNGDPDHDRNINLEVIRNNTELLKADPFIPFARNNLAAAYYHAGRFDEALRELEKAIDELGTGDNSGRR